MRRTPIELPGSRRLLSGNFFPVGGERNAVNRSMRQQGGLRALRGRARRMAAVSEALEGRLLLTSVVVNTVLDQMGPAGSKTVSLRDAIAVAANSTTPTAITFDSKVFATAQTIALASNNSRLEFTNAHPVTIIGPAAGVTVSGGGNKNVFVVDKGVTATVTGLTITDGLSYLGGGIDNAGELILTHSTISGNSTFGANGSNPGNGGGIENESGATLSLVDSTVSGNSTYGYSVPRGHFFPGMGGGIDNNGALTVTDSTVSGNSTYASGGGGIYNQAGATLTIANSIVADNGTDVAGAVKSLGYNLVGQIDGSSGWKPTDLTGTALKPLDPLLSPLGNFGGPTQTMAPLPGSPAIDHGYNVLIAKGLHTDQRGLPRIVNGRVDIGAVEAQLTSARIQLTGPAGQAATEGNSVAVKLGSFTTAAADAPYTVDVKWGDGSADDVFTVATPGALPARPHDFAVAGTYNVSVAVIDAGGNGSNVARFAMKVADAPLSGSAAPQPGLAVNLPFDGQLATFTDSDPNGMFSYYSATITWGDGTTSAGTIRSGSGLAVNGTHTYAKVGVYHFSVKVNDSHGASLSLLGTATVSPADARVIVVNTTKGQSDPAGSKTISLVDAVAIANKNTLPTTIRFDPTVFAMPRTINLNGSFSGAGLELSGRGAVTLIGPAAGVTVNGNANGVVVLVDPNVSAGFTGLTITGGSNSGAGLSNSGAVAVTRCALTGNAAGGIANFGAISLADSTVSGNTGEQFGNTAAILNTYAGTFAVTDSTISGNTGGGIFNTYGATFTLVDSTVSGNTTTSLGGGVDNYGGVVKLTNCTVSGNVAASYGDGGGIANDSLQDGGYGTIIAANTIIAGNSTIQNTAPDVLGPITSLGFNLVGQTDGSKGWIKTDLTGTSAKPLNPKLSLLGNFGGLTQTQVPQPGSPAINRGSNSLIAPGVTTDQRGMPRIVNGVVDIGAVEVQTQTAQLQITPPATQAAVEGKLALLQLGSFTAAHAAGPFNVYVNWGDGTSNTVLAVNAPGVIPAVSHAYTEEGPYTVTIALTDAAGDGPASAHFAVKVADAPLTGSAAAFKAFSQTTFTGAIATFTDTDPGGTLADYTATVAWGDGTKSVATIAAVSGTTFSVSDTHVYAKSGSYHFTVTVADAGGTTGSFSANATISTPSFVVNTTKDQTDAPGSATVSLRDVIGVANISVVPRTITFDPKVFATAQTITLDGTELEMFGQAGITITGPAAGVTVDGNHASRVFSVFGGGPASFTGLTITGGVSPAVDAPGADGGGIFNTSDGVTLTHCTVSGNSATAGGGGIANFGGMTLTNVTVAGNQAAGNGNGFGAGGGGGIENNGKLTLIASVVSGNTAAGTGGGINNYGTALTLTDVTLSGNKAGSYGGGVDNVENFGLLSIPGPIAMTRVTVSGNTAVNGNGGGIANDNPLTIHLINVTVTGNSAGGTDTGGQDGAGGGIFNAGVITLADVTVFANHATVLGGGIYDPTGGLTLANTIVAGNTAPTGPDASGTVTSLGFNLVGKIDGSTGWTSHDLTGTSAKPLDPKLQPLHFAGGLTRTLYPEAGSPAIDHGSNALVPSGITKDQRGFPRIVNGKVDIGAVEV